MNKLLPYTAFRKAWLLPGLLAFCVLAVPAQAQYSSDTNNRLNRLENEIETISRYIYKGETPPPTAFSSGSKASADTEVRLQQLESQIRDLNGKLEEQSYQLRQLKEQLDRALSDIEMRLGNGTGPAPQAGQVSSYPQAGATTPGSNYATPTSEPSTEGDYQWSSSGGGRDAAASAVKSGQLGTLTTSGSGETSSADSAAAEYENAFALLKNAQYEQAEQEFNSFIARYPDHILISNAKYWLGEAYYARGKYDDAARVFAEGYQQYPKGPKAADNLLKLAMALSGSGNNEDACVALGQLFKDFPAGSAPVLRRAEQEKARMKCP